MVREKFEDYNMPRTPTWNAKFPEVPVDKDGNWLQYPSYQQTEWKPVDPFHARMSVVGMYSGRSAKGIYLNDDTGKKYPMFVSDLVAALQNDGLVMEDGWMIGWWTAGKRGANYGVRFFGKDQP